MDSDRTRWSDPVHAQMAVQPLEEKLARPIDQPATDDSNGDDFDPPADVVETPD